MLIVFCGKTVLHTFVSLCPYRTLHRAQHIVNSIDGTEWS